MHDVAIYRFYKVMYHSLPYQQREYRSTLHSCLLPAFESPRPAVTPNFTTQRAVGSQTSIMEMPLIALAYAGTLLIIFTYISKYY